MAVVPLVFQSVGIEDDFPQRGRVNGFEPDEHGLLGRRLVAQGKDGFAAPESERVAGRFFRDQFFERLRQAVVKRQLVEIGAGAFVLLAGPVAHGGVGGCFEPLIILDDANAMIGIGDRFARGGNGRQLRRAGSGRR